MSSDGLGLEPRISGGNDRVRADVDAAEVAVAVGETTTVRVEVTNIDHVIRSYHVAVLGLDPGWIAVDHTALDLFPGERREVLVTFTLPEAFPSGRRTIAVEVSEPTAFDDAAVMIAFDLVMEAVTALELQVEPESVTVGRDGTLLLHPRNTGNTTLNVTLTGEDPERLTTVLFDPPVTHLVPGEQGLVRASVSGERPWFGMPAVRLLTFTADAGVTSAVTMAVFMQRPRISRRLLSLLGLLLVVTLFAFVILQAFSQVADRAEANDELLRQGLGEGEDQVVGTRIAPGGISGTVTSSTQGGLDSAVVELFEPTNPAFPVRSTVTDATGGYNFGSLADGTYLIRVEVPGFGEVWYPDADAIGDAEPIEIAAGAGAEGIDIELFGRPGSISGVVLGDDVVGATVSAQIPGEAIAGSELEPVPSVVASVELDATGRFVLEELATPGTYVLEIAKPGYATDLSTVTLRAGEQRDGIEVLLRRGDGRISGTVTDTSGTPLPNVTISATDGTTVSGTRSLSGVDTLGQFELRDLPTPGTYTLSISAPGYFSESVTLTLDAEQRIEDLAVVLTSDVGSISGRITDPSGQPLGGVDVTIVGPDIDRTTTSLSTGEVGSWSARDLPVPGAYTVTFGSPGTTTQAVSIELVAGPGATRTDVDAVLSGATASVSGTVTEPGTGPIGGVTIELDGGDVQRRTVSSDLPPGAYGFDDIAPGSYTITYSRAGSRAQTLLVDLSAGEVATLAPIALEPQARLSGTVTRDNVGESGVGVLVYAQRDYPRMVTAETVTTAGGEFEIIGLDAPETYIVEFRIPAGGSVVGSRTVFLPSGEDATVDFGL